MTLPFENDTDTIVKKLAKTSVKSDKQRLLYTSTTVAIAVALIMTLACTMFAAQHKMSIQAEKTPQAFLSHINADTYDKLKHDESIGKIISQYAFEKVKYYDEVSLQAVFCDDPAYFSDTTLTGKLPQKSNEIVLTSGSLAYLPEGIAVGSHLPLNLGTGENDYIVSGIIELASERARNIGVYCSEEYLLEAVAAENIDYTLLLFWNNPKDLSQEDVAADLTQLSEKYNIPSNDTSISSRYFSLASRNIDIQELLKILLAALVVFFAAAVVIYNIFYISISRKTQEYGQLRTIGMTPRQVKKMISAEGKKIAMPGIASGIIVGAAIGSFVQPEGWYWLNTVIAALIAFVFGVLTIKISIYSPAKMAGKISPMEAVSYSGYSNEKISGNGKRHKITPFTLAKLNLVRNKKKTALTILSLGLCGVMLIACASIRNSLSETNMARTGEFQYGDFKLEFEGNSSMIDSLGGEAKNYNRAALQANSNVFSAELKQKVLSIDGVKDIKEWFGTTALFYINGKKDQTTIWGYTEDELSKMENNLVSGTANMAELEQGNGIIVNIAENAPQTVYHWTPQLGDEVTLSFWSKSGIPVIKTFTIMGITDGKDGFSNIFRLPFDELQKVTDYDITSDWEIITENAKEDTVETALQDVVKNAPELSLNTLQEYVNTLSGQYRSGIFTIYVLVLFLGVFGIINLVNLTGTNQIIRKNESGIMLAVGLTKRQLRSSRIYEGELLVISSALIASAIGIPLGYRVTNTFKMIGAVEQYLFPLREYLIFIFVLCFVELALELLLNRSLKKESLVELLRNK
ncbi:MAG: hypothetical protein PHR92_05030 [Lachnospiraceae bacterium]|nr:hypothetical protein [Lachnospiraceae bacterium]